MIHTPILFMLFNRPEHTARVFQRILLVKPSRLFISADGPRRDHPDDADRCAQVRQIVAQVPKETHATRLFHDENLGCKRSGMTALSWFFSENDQGIVLEDDTLPDPSFFAFAEAALNKYKDDERVMLVSGHNPLGSFRSVHDAVFSKFPFIWGWASWKRAWKNFDPQMRAWGAGESTEKIKRWLRSRHASSFWLKAMRDAAEGSDVWDYQLSYSMYTRETLALVTSRNLVLNFGFGADAVHTRNPNDSRQNMAVHSAPANPSFPQIVAPEKAFDRALVRELYFNSDLTGLGMAKSAARRALRKIHARKQQ